MTRRTKISANEGVGIRHCESPPKDQRQKRLRKGGMQEPGDAMAKFLLGRMKKPLPGGGVLLIEEGPLSSYTASQKVNDALRLISATAPCVGTLTFCSHIMAFLTRTSKWHRMLQLTVNTRHFLPFAGQ